MRASSILAFLLLVTGVLPARSDPGPVIDRGVVYRRLGDRVLVLDVYRPRDVEARLRPGVICIHGGSWDSGDRWDLAGAARELAGRGFVAATIDYRLSCEAPFPAAV